MFYSKLPKLNHFSNNRIVFTSKSGPPTHCTSNWLSGPDNQLGIQDTRCGVSTTKGAGRSKAKLLTRDTLCNMSLIYMRSAPNILMGAFPLLTETRLLLVADIDIMVNLVPVDILANFSCKSVEVITL